MTYQHRDRAPDRADARDSDRDRCRVGGCGRSRADDRGRDRGRAGDHGRDRGQVALEFLGFLPILLIVAMAAVQLGLISYAAQQAGTAARAGARSASLDGPYAADCRAAVSGWVSSRMQCARADLGDEVAVTVTVDIPSVVPGWNFDPARKTATMPRDH
jgi:hypothetical protein